MLSAFDIKLQLPSFIAPADRNILLTLLCLCLGIMFPLIFIEMVRRVKKALGRAVYLFK